MINADQIKRVQSIDTVEPMEGFGILAEDCIREMRRRRVSEDAIKGMQIALQIAFRLGEKFGIQNVARAQ